MLLLSLLIIPSSKERDLHPLEIADFHGILICWLVARNKNRSDELMTRGKRPCSGEAICRRCTQLVTNLLLRPGPARNRPLRASSGGFKVPGPQLATCGVYNKDIHAATPGYLVTSRLVLIVVFGECAV